MKLEEMTIYKDSHELAVEFRQFFKCMSNDDKYSYGQQMLRSSCSVPSNIAEGVGKRVTNKMMLNYLNIARGSLLEFKTQLSIIEADYSTPNLMADMNRMKEKIRLVDDGIFKFSRHIQKQSIVT